VAVLSPSNAVRTAMQTAPSELGDDLHWGLWGEFSVSRHACLRRTPTRLKPLLVLACTRAVAGRTGAPRLFLNLSTG